MTISGHLNNLDYAVCIKTEEGFCGVAYSAVGDGSNSTGFEMEGAAEKMREPDVHFPPKFGEQQCKSDFIQIPRGRHPEVLPVSFLQINILYCLKLLIFRITPEGIQPTDSVVVFLEIVFQVP